MRRIERTHKQLLKRAWDAFSLFIRLRDCLKTTGTIDRGKCYTCGRIYHFKDLQAGHFVRGRGGAVLFDELGVKAQDEGCNIFRDGEVLIFRKNLVKEVGEEVVEILESKRWKIKKRSKVELEALCLYYRQEHKKLLDKL